MMWLLLGLALAVEPVEPVEPRMWAPALILPSLEDGASFDVADQRGSVVLVDFWATWCLPCKLKLREHQQLAREVPGLVVVAVNVDKKNYDLAVRSYVKREAYDFVVVRDRSASVFQSWDPTGTLPYSALVDRQGVIIAEHPDADAVRSAVEGLGTR